MMADHDELFLCKPCAEEMKDYKTVDGISYVQSASRKDTCELCKRRRYGYICKVKYRELQRQVK